MKTNKLVQGALIASLFGVLAVLNTMTGTMFDSLIGYGMAIPMAIYSYKTGLKEALMTVVIIDTIQQLYKNRKERLLLKNIYYVLESLDMQIIYLKNHYRSSSKYIARLKIFSGSIEDECRKKENKIKFYIFISYFFTL